MERGTMSNDVEERENKYVTIPLQLLIDGKFPEDINAYTRGWNDALEAAYLIAENWIESD